MQGRILKSFALAAVLVAASAALQASPAPQNRPPDPRASAQDSSRFSLQGKITKVEAGKFTVNTGENILFHVRYDDKTEITRADGSKGSEKDLRAGVWVEVEGDLEESGEIAAATIKLQEQKPQKP
jgi:Domain of unknown function (DUF5666)